MDRDYYEVQGEGTECDDPMDEGYNFKPAAEYPVCDEPREISLTQRVNSPSRIDSKSPRRS